MKKFFALALAALLTLACVPALAFTGFVSDPGVPEVAHVEEPLYTVDVKRVENEPVVTEDEWGDEVYEWNYMDNETPIAVGDTVTLSCEIQVPEALPFDAELTEQMESLFVFLGYTDLELVMAYGCDANYECDYEHGYCYVIPGYGNAEVVGGYILEVHPHLGSNIRVIVRGTASAENVRCDAVSTVGQYCVPTHFSCGKLEKTGNTYFIHYKDTFMVQDRGMKFIAEDGHIVDYYVYLNNHDYHRVLDLKGQYKYVDVADGHEETEGVKYEALELAYNTYMSFFGFTDDNNSDYLTDGVFLYGAQPVRFSETFTIGAKDEPEPTDEPQPTEPAGEPDPTDEPTPVPDPPKTGAVSFTALGIIAIVSGAAVAMRKKNK